MVGMKRKYSTCKDAPWPLMHWASDLGFFKHFFFFLFDPVDVSGLSINSGLRLEEFSRVLDKVPSGPSFCLCWDSFLVRSDSAIFGLDMFPLSFTGLLWWDFPDKIEDLSLSPRQHLGMVSPIGISLDGNFPD